jgi:hypothetical protein
MEFVFKAATNGREDSRAILMKLKGPSNEPTDGPFVFHLL